MAIRNLIGNLIQSKHHVIFNRGKNHSLINFNSQKDHDNVVFQSEVNQNFDSSQVKMSFEQNSLNNIHHAEQENALIDTGAAI